MLLCNAVRSVAPPACRCSSCRCGWPAPHESCVCTAAPMRVHPFTLHLLPVNRVALRNLAAGCVHAGRMACWPQTAGAGGSHIGGNHAQQGWAVERSAHTCARLIETTQQKAAPLRPKRRRRALEQRGGEALSTLWRAARFGAECPAPPWTRASRGPPIRPSPGGTPTHC